MKGLHQGDKAGKIQSPENPDPKLCFHLWLCAAHWREEAEKSPQRKETQPSTKRREGW